MKQHPPLPNRVHSGKYAQDSPPASKANFWHSSWDLFGLLCLSGFLALLMSADDRILPGVLPAIRLVFGLAFGLFAPGYALQAALFPNPTDQERLARLALSIGCSISIFPPLALLLDRLPWGLRPWPSLLSLVILMLLFSGIALFRRLRLGGFSGPVPAIKLDWKHWWSAQDLGDRRLLILVSVGIFMALLSVLAILSLPKPGDRYTEFYMLGQFGLAQDYPREASAGEHIPLTIGITNKEHVPSIYTILVMASDQVLTKVGPIALENDQSLEQVLEFALPRAGNDQQILILLEREEQPFPYRTLRLWINVKPVVGP